MAMSSGAWEPEQPPAMNKLGHECVFHAIRPQFRVAPVAVCDLQWET